MKITDEMVLAAARAAAKFDARSLDVLGRINRERYMQLARVCLEEAVATIPVEEKTEPCKCGGNCRCDDIHAIVASITEENRHEET